MRVFTTSCMKVLTCTIFKYERAAGIILPSLRWLSLPFPQGITAPYTVDGLPSTLQLRKVSMSTTGYFRIPVHNVSATITAGKNPKCRKLPPHFCVIFS